MEESAEAEESEEESAGFDRVEVYSGGKRRSLRELDEGDEEGEGAVADEPTVFEVGLRREAGESLGLGIGFDDDGRVVLLTIGPGARPMPTTPNERLASYA